MAATTKWLCQEGCWGAGGGLLALLGRGLHPAPSVDLARRWQEENGEAGRREPSQD